jgi:beta-glucosidase
VAQSRIDDMVRRILRALFAKGVVDHPVGIAPIDFAADEAVSQRDAEAAIVLLKNAHALLPLQAGPQKIAIIGAHADVGVLSGGGSSQVYPVGGAAVPGLGPAGFPGPLVYDPSSPLQAIAARLPAASLRFAGGTDLRQAALLAAHSDIAIVFAHQWTAESLDTSLVLPDGQDALIDAVARANPRTVVVLQTGGPVLMPWLGHVSAVLEAWYPGTRGGQAIARVLAGDVDASGRLPVTFPRAEEQVVRPGLDGDPAHPGGPFVVDYAEGAAVGYKWFDLHRLQPQFPFGFGLSYGRFAYSGLTASMVHDVLTVAFDIKNIGPRAAWDVPQIYAASEAGLWEAPKRLVGWQKVLLRPGASQHVEIRVDPRLLSVWDQVHQRWAMAGGRYRIMLGRSSCGIVSGVEVQKR